MSLPGMNYIIPLGGYGGGHVKWTPGEFAVDVELTKYNPGDGLKPKPPTVVAMRLPWRAFAQILVTRDDVR